MQFVELYEEFMKEVTERGVVSEERWDYYRKSHETIFRKNMINNGYHFHHSAYHNGYIEKHPFSAFRTPYDGRYGTGYILHRHDADGAAHRIYNRHIVEYWVKE